MIFTFEAVENNKNKVRVIHHRGSRQFDCGLIAFEEGLTAPVFQGGAFGYPNMPPCYLNFLDLEEMMVEFWSWLNDNHEDLWRKMYFKPEAQYDSTRGTI